MCARRAAFTKGRLKGLHPQSRNFFHFAWDFVKLRSFFSTSVLEAPEKILLQAPQFLKTVLVCRANRRDFFGTPKTED